MKRTGALAVLALLPLLAACPGNPFDGAECTTDVHPAVEVGVRDGRTGVSILNGATVIVRDWAVTDSVTVRDPLESYVRMQQERAGTYEVVVRKDGYREWKRSGVKVGRDECHVKTVRVEAVLEPLR